MNVPFSVQELELSVLPDLDKAPAAFTWTMCYVREQNFSLLTAPTMVWACTTVFMPKMQESPV